MDQIDKEDIIKIAEGIRMIEEGVETIQNVMREKKYKSLADVAAELIPVLKEEDNSLRNSIVTHLK